MFGKSCIFGILLLLFCKYHYGQITLTIDTVVINQKYLTCKVTVVNNTNKSIIISRLNSTNKEYFMNSFYWNVYIKKDLLFIYQNFYLLDRKKGKEEKIRIRKKQMYTFEIDIYLLNLENDAGFFNTEFSGDYEIKISMKTIEPKSVVVESNEINFTIY